MSLYDELPVFKASYDLLLNIFQFTANFSREYKYTIGEKLKNETLALIVLVYRANSSQSKVEIIQQAHDAHHTIILIDGKKLVDLMHFYNVGVQIKSTYEVKELDIDFFEGN
jgi:restriction endonuclease Mrr